MAHYIVADRAARESPTKRVKIDYETKTDALSLIRRENVAIAARAEGKPAARSYLTSMAREIWFRWKFSTLRGAGRKAKGRFPIAG
jgi:hypothetical protein